MSRALAKVLKETVQTGVDQGLQLVPITVVTVSPLTVRIRGSVETHPAEFIAGQAASVGDNGFAFWLPGKTGLLVLETTQAGASYWIGANSSADSASTVSGWVTLSTAPVATDTDDTGNSTFLPIAGGIRILVPGTYTVEFAVLCNTGVAGTRMGLGLFTTGSNAIPSGGNPGSPMPGYSLTGAATNNGNYYEITRTFILTGTEEIRGCYYSQSTSHSGQITRLQVNRTR